MNWNEDFEASKQLRYGLYRMARNGNMDLEEQIGMVDLEQTAIKGNCNMPGVSGSLRPNE